MALLAISLKFLHRIKKGLGRLGEGGLFGRLRVGGAA